MSDQEIKAMFDRNAADLIFPVSLALALLYLFVTGVHLLTLPLEMRAEMAVVSSLSVVVLAGLAWLSRKKTLPASWGHPLLTAVTLVVALNSCIHLLLEGEMRQTTNIILLLIGLGSFFFNARYFVLVVSLVVCLWLWMLVFLPKAPVEQIHFGLAVVFSVFLSALIFTIRMRNLDQLYSTQRNLEHLVITDSLTQVANRRRFEEVINQQWREMRREQRPLSLILCDVDQFKLYNDTMGHQRGDEVLRNVAAAIEASVRRPVDLVARYGGDEFAVILPSTGAEGAFQLAESIRHAVASLSVPHVVRSGALYLTISLGVSTVLPGQTGSVNRLIERVDQALYKAKSSGRNRTVIS